MPMTMNLKLLSDNSSETVDATLCRQIIGLLMHLMNTRPNICFVVNTLSQYMVEPICVHLISTKHVLRYLRGTIDYVLQYVADCEFRLMGYTDLDWVDSVTDQNSTLGGCFNLGSVVISWINKK